MKTKEELKKYNNEWYKNLSKEQIEKRKNSTRKWHKKFSSKNPEIIKKRNKKQYKSNIEKRNDYRLKYTYGITLKEYDSLYIKQGGVCDICKQPESTRTESGLLKKLSVDHDHDTGKNRGLLCGNCNIGLGKFKDSVLFLESAKQYLIKNL